ncbi:YjeJ family protein, partial [Klebsiella pneumoniae]|uniref:YjeJ family protein n=2 Tax=Klebsiella pneumoniae TaxID=573 RepID=UPI0020B852A2
MLSTVLGFNTAIIKQNDNFLALALKIKRSDNTCQTYYLQYTTLTDLLIILRNQLHRVLMNPLMILVKIIKLRWIHILSYDQMV